MSTTRHERNKATRCGHPWCSDCKTKRGRNRGNRRLRQRVKQALRRADRQVTD